MAVNYGTFSFPSPTPSVVVADQPVVVGGELDYSIRKITLVGNITGSNLASLSLEKKRITTGLLNTYQTLDVEGNSFPYSKPISVSFDESDLTTILPYSVEFESLEEKNFSQYYGVLNPQNSWAFKEGPNRVVEASHTVSAQGTKVNGSDPLSNARNFVNSELNGFENLSIINPSGYAFLQSKTEEVDRFSNSYSVTENYSFSTSREPIYPQSGIITATTQINYSKNQGASVSVNGSIRGDMTGERVTVDLFSSQNAKDLASLALERSKSNYETSVYNTIQNGPSTYNYNVNTGANTIDFSFAFANPYDYLISGVRHVYTVSVSPSKDDNKITTTIEGVLTYDDSADIFVNGPIESAPRFVKIQQVFSGLDLYNLAWKEYSDFVDVISEYGESKYMNPNAVSESITKSPFVPSLSYSYGFDNKESSGNLRNLSVQITDQKPISGTTVKESNVGFSAQTLINRSLGKIEVSLSCDEEEDTLQKLRQEANSYLRDKNCQLIDESFNSGSDKISYNVGYHY
jgi:hypothetical protein